MPSTSPLQPSTSQEQRVMTMLRPSLLLTVVTLVVSIFQFSNAQNATAQDIASLSISGWWSDCDYNADTACTGNYKEYPPVPLDPTGNTCYVNPHVSPASSTKNVVFWLGPEGLTATTSSDASTGIYLYVLRVPDDSVEEHLPTNCTESGACSCESVDSLRAPWRTTSSCIGGCSVTPADNLVRLDETCAVLYKESVINAFFNDTIVTCAIQGTLIDTSSSSSSTPTAAPTTGGGADTSGGYGQCLKAFPWLGLIINIGVFLLF